MRAAAVPPAAPAPGRAAAPRSPRADSAPPACTSRSSGTSASGMSAMPLSVRCTVACNAAISGGNCAAAGQPVGRLRAPSQQSLHVVALRRAAQRPAWPAQPRHSAQANRPAHGVIQVRSNSASRQSRMHVAAGRVLRADPPPDRGQPDRTARRCPPCSAWRAPAAPRPALAAACWASMGMYGSFGVHGGCCSRVLRRIDEIELHDSSGR